MNTIVADKISFSFPAEILKQVEQNGEFHVVGYAATTDFDLQGDIITEEALQNASLDLLKNSTVLLNHDLARPIGKVTKVDFDRHGLLIDALISQTEPDIIQIFQTVCNFNQQPVGYFFLVNQDVGLFQKALHSLCVGDEIW